MCETACNKQLDLDPLTAFGGDPLHCESVEPSSIPPPYQDLLVHPRDMTSTLEGFIGQPLRLRVIEKRVESLHVRRRVLLVGEADGTIAEFGAILIRLEALPQPARSQVIACERPLGSILTSHSLAFRSKPSAYFRLQPDVQTKDFLRLPVGARPYGRRNVLSTPDGDVIADIVEILPMMNRHEHD